MSFLKHKLDFVQRLNQLFIILILKKEIFRSINSIKTQFLEKNKSRPLKIQEINIFYLQFLHHIMYFKFRANLDL